MLEKFLAEQIKAQFSYTPTSQQTALLNTLSSFLCRNQGRQVFLLKGYAGTGKTTLVGAIVKTMVLLKQGVLLAAPTGRAAKVLSAYSGYPAQTLHRLIYRKRSDEPGAGFDLDFNKHPHTLFIVDEASMLAESGGGDFGSGNLLADLLRYVFQAEACKLLLLGDTAQLPPVGCEESPALDADALRGYNLDVEELELTQVLRQSQQGGILQNATTVRDCLEAPHRLLLSLSEEVQRVDSGNFLACMEHSYQQVGEEQTLVITRCNKRATAYNTGIRGRLLYKEEALCRGDLLMVVKNNYLVGVPYQLDLVANGDVARVEHLYAGYSLYGFHFRKVGLYFPDYEQEMEVLLLEESLYCPSPIELQTLNQRLYEAVAEDYAEIRNKRERYRRMRLDVHLNALQGKFAYAVTCHKAQGGQWKHVYVDMGRMPEGGLNRNDMRWLYTAVTRATEKLYLVQFPNELF